MKNSKLLYILNNMSEFSTEDLRALNKSLVNNLQFRNKQQLNELKHSIKVGDYVTVDHKKTSGKIFKVTSMRRTKSSIYNVSNTTESYNLPISMMVKTNETHDDLVSLGLIK